MQALNNTWMPDAALQFPLSGKRNLKFQYSWFARFTWLSYSKEQDGTFCKFCVLFAPQTGVGRNNQRPGRLVVTKYDKWKNALQAFHEHQLTDYHNDCVKAAENLQKVARRDPFG